MIRRLVLGGALGGVALSVVLAALGADWWALPAIVVAVALGVRIMLVAERSGATVATMRRNAERVRVLEKERHEQVISSVASIEGRTGERRSPAPEKSVPPPLVSRRPQEHLDGPDSVTFAATLPAGSSSVGLWLEVGGFDLLPAEYAVSIHAGGSLLWSGQTPSCEAGSMVSLGDFDSRTVADMVVRVAWPSGLRTGLPPALAFVGLVALVDHPVLPGAAIRIPNIGVTDEQ